MLCFFNYIHQRILKKVLHVSNTDDKSEWHNMYFKV